LAQEASRARLILNDLDVETAEELERRAQRLGTTPEEEASRLLRDRLRGEPAPTGADAAASDPRFVRQHGFLIFTGEVAPEEIPDHRALREERVDALLKGASGRHCLEEE
jgi:plasmid stability protein